MYTLGLNDNVDHFTPVNLPQARSLITNHHSRIWTRDIQNVPKLRTYRLFKTEFKTEEYLLMNFTKKMKGHY